MQIQLLAAPRPARVAVAALALLGAACGGDGPTQPSVASVSVSPATVALAGPGANAQLAARAVGADGRQVSGEPVAWSSAAPAIATVDGSGLVTAVAPGATTVTATVAGVSGSAQVSVNEVGCDDPVTVQLSAGERAVFDDEECLLLPSSTSGDRYRVVVYRPDSADAGSVVEARLTVTGQGVSLAPPFPRPRPAPSVVPRGVPGLTGAMIDRSIAISEATTRFHAELRAREAELVRETGPEKLAPRVRAGPLVARAGAASPAKLRLDPSTPNSCQVPGAAQVTAVLVHENDDVAIYQDSTQRVSDPVTVSQASRMATYYSAYGKPVVEAYFGTPSDIDGNGKLVVFASPAASGDVAAFVWSGDFFTRDACGASNEMELIFFNTDLIQAMDSTENPNHQALETLAHEAKHVVSLYNRIQGGSRFHPGWIEEGAAEIAANMSARVAWANIGGPPLGAAVTRTDFVNTAQANGDAVPPEMYGVLLRMARTIWYLSSQPNALKLEPAGAGDGHSIYGTGWHFHRWLGDAYGGATAPMGDAPLFRALSDSTAGRGEAGLFQQTGKRFDVLFEEFLHAVALHGTGGPEPERTFTTYDFVTATDVLAEQPVGAYPWPVTERATEGGETIPATFASATYAGPLGPTGVRIHDFLSNGTGTGALLGLSVDQAAKIMVVRIR